MDIKARNPRFIEKIPDYLLKQIIEIVSSIFKGDENA